MISHQGSASTPAHYERHRSISPQPLDSTNEKSTFRLSSNNASDSIVERGPSKSVTKSSFSTLPAPIILRILWAVDANTFASLCMLNRQWRQEADTIELYAHHLSRCPSYALGNNVISGPFRRNDLARIKAKFAAEVRRNLFGAYLCPRRTLINLISFHTNSSAAFPTGEAFRFEFSPNARTIIALSSSRIYVLDATADPPLVIRQLKTLRRPLSASITDDGSLLAVLSSKHQVNIYGLTPRGVQHLQVIALDNPPKIIAIAHEGTVLAASYETGIEVFSLAANSLTTDRRSVRSEAVDTLNFSGDGSMLVGSSLSLDDPNAVVISAPFYTENDPDLSHREVHSRMWTTQILFPQISSVCSHVALLPSHNEGDAYWLFAFDHSLMSYRAVRTDDTRSGVAYFLSPPGADRFDTPVPTIAPSATACGTLTVAGFEGSELCLYGIPERLDLSPDMGAVIERQNERMMQTSGQLTSATGNFEPLMAYSPSTSASDHSIEDDSLASKVDWRQSLFVKCRNLTGLQGQTAARWVEDVDGAAMQSSKRLVVVAPGGVSLGDNELGDEDMPVDGSRMCLLDFGYSPSVLGDRTITIEVGEDEAELLTEHTGSLANEVAMERRRTIRAIPNVEGQRTFPRRSVTAIAPPSMPLFEEAYRRGSASTPSSPVEQAYSPTSQTTNGIQRSVTASGFRHARFPPRPPLGTVQYTNPGQAGYQRTNYQGRPISEDSWETPPPPYTGGNSPMPTQQQPNPNSPTFRNPLERPNQSSPAARQNLTSPQSNPYRPYRLLVADRNDANLDTLMTSHAVPTGGTISQHQELMMAARSRGPSEGGSDMHTELSRGSASPGGLRISNRSSLVNRRNIDSSTRIRPMTHHGEFPQGWPGMNRSMSDPSSPSISGSNRFVNDGHGAISPISSPLTPGLSLTGANLYNRLNHPVPPIPPISESDGFHNPRTSTQVTQYGQLPQNSSTQHQQSQVYPTMPTQDQVMKLHQRMSSSEQARPPTIINTDFVHRPAHSGIPPSPPRGAWGATGVPGSPTFHQARNVPNGFSGPRTGSRDSQRSNLASASAPNLLAQRPKYGRLDTIDSINDPLNNANNGVVPRSRAHSMNQAVVFNNMEPSAYHETSRGGTNSMHTKYAKKVKKKKDETTKRGTRCVVM